MQLPLSCLNDFTRKSFSSTAPPGKTNLLGIKLAFLLLCPIRTDGFDFLLRINITEAASLISEFLFILHAIIW